MVLPPHSSFPGDRHTSMATTIHPWRPPYIHGDLSHALHSCVGQRLRTVHGLPVWPSKCPMAGRCPQPLPIRPTLFPHHLSLERVPGTAILRLSLSPTCKSPRPSWASVDSLPIMLMSHKASEGRKQSLAGSRACLPLKLLATLHIQDEGAWATCVGPVPPSKERDRDRGAWGNKSSAVQLRKE